MVIALWVWWILVVVTVVANIWYWVRKGMRLSNAWCLEHPKEAARMTPREKSQAGGARRLNFIASFIFMGQIAVGGIGTAVIVHTV